MLQRTGHAEPILDHHTSSAAQDALQELETIYDRAPIGLAVVNRELRFRRINERLAELNGIPAAAHIGRTIRELLPKIADIAEAPLRHVLETGEPLRDVELVGETPARPGEIRTWVEQWFPIRDRTGAVVGVNVVAVEVTEQRRAMAERDRLLREAEAASRAKGQFLAVMSHELRTPLNAIGGYAELMEMGLRGPITEQQRSDLARIRKSQRHLLGLINQVLNYTRVETGATTYDITDVAVGDALASAEALIVPQVRAKGLTYVLAASDPALRVRADVDKLQQILLNLLGNAVKFTDEGGRITVTPAATGDTVSIAIADTGIGIDPAKLPSIFDPFVQADQRLTRAAEGIGLGLAISRDLARGMRGDLRVESREGVGSTFTLRLPASTAS
ncbi:MAG: PAS domain-containing protein [Gemmatimonadaceae bacterium]|nr:PAS domain-containing protein [Gemmatimonadaceae bacterium]